MDGGFVREDVLHHLPLNAPFVQLAPSAKITESLNASCAAFLWQCLAIQQSSRFEPSAFAFEIKFCAERVVQLMADFISD